MQYHLVSLPSSYIQTMLPTKEELSGGQATLPRPVPKSPADWGWSRQEDTLD